MPFYLGRRSEDDLILFHSAMPPTKQTHGHLYKVVIGPFVSRVGAGYFARYGRSNPKIRTAADAERLARADPRMEQLIIEESLTAGELAIARECDAQDQAEYSPQPTLPVENRQGLFLKQGAIPCPIGMKTN
jgi:hypothetical protein